MRGGSGVRTASFTVSLGQPKTMAETENPPKARGTTRTRASVALFAGLFGTDETDDE